MMIIALALSIACILHGYVCSLARASHERSFMCGCETDCAMQVQSIHDSEDWFHILTTTPRTQVAMMELAPGMATGDKAEAHARSDQVLLVIRGCIQGKIGDKQVRLEPGKFVVIPADTKHRFFNNGTEPAVTFNVYAGPAYPPGTKG